MLTSFAPRSLVLLLSRTWRKAILSHSKQTTRLCPPSATKRTLPYSSSSCHRTPVMHGSSVVVGDETTKTSTNSNDHNQNHTHMSNGTTSKSAHSLEDEISPSQNLSEQCERVNKRVYDFLNRAPSDEKVESVQRMTRESLGVIEQALERYT